MKILIGLGSCGIASGAKSVESAIRRSCEKNQVKVDLRGTGCIGICFAEPVVDVIDDDGALTRYVRVQPQDGEEIVREHVLKGRPVKRLLAGENEIQFLKEQTRVVLKRCGIIDPEDIDDYIQAGGYEALEKALLKMSDKDLCSEITGAGLRGRGGSGFPTGKKWDAVRTQKSKRKYVICNGDEGDPGAFMDRNMMEGDPHSVIEGMIIAGRAVGASRGFIYVRAEYPLAVKRLKKAVAQAKEKGYLGENILGSDFSFCIEVCLGAGAFVCGESSAIAASIEGKRATPKEKIPHMSEKGLFGKPTLVNNVETLANITEIIKSGAESFEKLGTEKSPGTKVISITGKTKRPGMIEVPMGTSIADIVYSIGGGVKGDRELKGVLIGGPMGCCLSVENMDIPLDFEAYDKYGMVIGSGGFVVLDDSVCIVNMAKYYMGFIQKESCGKCVPCRSGSHIMLELLEDITDGKGTMEHLGILAELGDTISNTTLCNLGRTGTRPVLDTLRLFPDDYEAHILDKLCPARGCPALARVEIIPELCSGCGKCELICPKGAITSIGDGELFEISPDDCINCGSCIDCCNFGAILEG